MNFNSNEVVIVDGVRTPFVKAGQSLNSIHAKELGCITLRELIDRNQIPLQMIDEVIMGNVENPPNSTNISRVIALYAGLPESVSAFSVHRNCGSALESVTCATTRIQSKSIQVAIAGGTESMSNYPFLFSNEMVQIFLKLIHSSQWLHKIKALSEMKLRFLKPRLALLEGLCDPFTGISMGGTAEILAKEFGISREEQDQFALQSHLKALKAEQNGFLAKERVSVVTSKQVIEKDQGPRKNSSMEKLSQLKPCFDKKYGSVTVGNSCPITDGAVSLLLMHRNTAEAFGYTPKAFIKSFAYAGCPPPQMGLGPVIATAKLLKQCKLSLKHIDCIEINEAFSAQVLSCLKAFSSTQFATKYLNQSQALGEIDPQKLNVNGGAIALGHPVGATGSRLLLTLIHQLKQKKAQYGLATLCIGGGQGGAVLIENI